MKKTLVGKIAVLNVCLALLTGCSHESKEPTVAPAPKVSAVVVGEDNGTSNGRSTTYSGTVSASNTATVSFAIPGTIQRLFVSEGQHVTAGQKLAQLNTSDYVNSDNIARAQLVEAQDALERLRKLHDANALPEIKWVEVQQKVRQAQEAAEVTRHTLSQTTMYAPISGVVTKKYPGEGANVAPVEPVYEITSLETLTINISVPETSINKVTLNTPASVLFAGMDTIEGVVSEKAVTADPLTRSYSVKVAIPTSKIDGREILPGMTGSVVLALSAVPTAEASPANTIEIPSQAVQLSNDNRTYVWVVKDGTAERRFITPQTLTSTGVTVSEGLVRGDTLIVEGMSKVSNGMKVEVHVKP